MPLATADRREDLRSVEEPWAADRVGGAGQVDRLVQAGLRCVGRWGVAKTSLDDVAREARCSRATVYRAFPGGKCSLADAILASETQRFISFVTAALDSEETLEDALVAAMSGAGSWLSHHEPLQFLLDHEPELLLPMVSFSAFDRVLADVRRLTAPHLCRWLEPLDAERVAEWAARLVVSYSALSARPVDITSSQSVREMVSRFVLPGVAALASAGEPASVVRSSEKRR